MVLQLCLTFNNFNTSYAIFCGLNLAAISRLKQTQEKVSKKSAAALKDIEKVPHGHLYCGVLF
jgi:hypothetical protein